MSHASESLLCHVGAGRMVTGRVNRIGLDAVLMRLLDLMVKSVLAHLNDLWRKWPCIIIGVRNSERFRR